jgi:radical SAM superfamily enzyme YgiQ (UPF0313 family)
MRIALLSPKGPLYRYRGGIFKKSLRYAPLTLTTLAALVPEELRGEIILRDEGIQEIDPELDADVVGITAITGTAPRSYEWADHFRSRGIPVILGGPHATLMPQEALRHADAVVVGYAEESWPRLLRDLAAGDLRTRYDQGPNHSLAGMPIPRRELLPPGAYLTPHTVEATRACRHDCEFCVVPSAWGTRPYQKPVEEVVADIRSMKSRRIVFLDLNLVADPGYAGSLFEALIPLRISWFGLSTVLLALNRELLDLCARSGCRGLLVGFESLSGGSVRSARKGFNTPGRYREIIRRFHERQISLMGCFVFGLDEDDPGVFERTAAFAVEEKIDLPRFAIATPFPGTPMHGRLDAEGRILTRDWSLYDGQHVVFQPKNMRPEELLRGTEWAWKKTYGLGSIGRRLVGSHRQPLQSLALNLGYRYYARRLERFYTCEVLT